MKTLNSSAPWLLNTEAASYNGENTVPTAIINVEKQVICLLGETGTSAEKIANARLIANAPDLAAHFPNGFESWHETHFEIVSAIHSALITHPISSPLVAERQEEQGHSGLYELAQELTDAFEQEFAGIAWGEELEYFDTIELWVAYRFRSVNNIKPLEFRVLSPDGFDIEMRGEWYKSLAEAREAITRFCEQYAEQGYYSRSDCSRLTLEEIPHYCLIKAVEPWEDEEEEIEPF